jgi:hypothetical protein
VEFGMEYTIGNELLLLVELSYSLGCHNILYQFIDL